jgi:hypothetical protein
MSKLQIRNPLLITALALAPSVAFAAGDSNPSKTTTTTTNTTVVPTNGKPPAAPPATTSASGSLDNPSGSAVLSPATPPDMKATDEAQNRSGNPDQAGIDPAQVQKVFGMDVALIDLKALNKDQIKQLQQRLQERGLYRGKIDGAMGPQTRNALSGLMAQQYSLNQRLMNQGQITEQFASSIGVDTHGRAPVTGVDLNPATTPAAPPPANQ